jgi:glucose-6-phosphate 1-epimerase
MGILSTTEDLDRRFAIGGIAQVVPGEGGLPKVRINTPQAQGEMYLHGAQVTSWKPAGTEEVIFLSKQAQWHEGIAIRGGIPICFPWFRAKTDDPKAPSHGLVRTKAWNLEAITSEGDSVTVVMSTMSDDDTRKWWPGDFRLVHRVTFGPELKLQLVVANGGTGPLRFEEALHTYHKVGHIKHIQIHGLDGANYLDNTDSNREKTQHGDVVIMKPTDSAYLNTQDEIVLVDGELKRRIHIAKQNSFTTVVWNPWREGAKSLSDLGNDEWQHMVCIEASNVLGYAFDLSPTHEHMMQAAIRVDAL